MQVDLYASHSHYRDHALPVWLALPSAVRGDSQSTGASKNLLIVASYADLIANAHRRCVYVEHGAGQTYAGLPREVAPFYSPLVVTKQHRNVDLFICPNDEVAARWSGSYDRPAVVVGCPKLDPWHSGLRLKHEPPVVAITFHWNPPASVWTVVPELQWCFELYWPVLREAIAKWRADGWHVIGHAHPRATAVLDFWRSEGVELVHESAEILDRAHILIADNTSVTAEMMSLGRGVVFLNHPAYRRDVEHGGRFWQWPDRAGISIDTPADLAQLELRSCPASTWHPYAYADGHAAERAVGAILSLS